MENVSQIYVRGGVDSANIVGMIKRHDLAEWVISHSAWDMTRGVVRAAYITAAPIAMIVSDKLRHIDHDWIAIAVILGFGLIVVMLNYRTDLEEDPSRLHIYFARWSYGNWPWQIKDRTAYVRSCIKDNRVDIPVTGAHFGDPKFGVPKTLTVKYSFAGFTQKVSLPEARLDTPSRLVLPQPELREVLEKMLKEFPMDKS